MSDPNKYLPEEPIAGDNFSTDIRVERAAYSQPVGPRVGALRAGY
jgi:hypothetical protein